MIGLLPVRVWPVNFAVVQTVEPKGICMGNLAEKPNEGA
jgi:hypothetical protein